MLTTFTERALADITVKYKFFQNKLTIIIETLAAHNVFGEVNIELAECEVVNIYSAPETLLEDVFNDTFLFKAVSATRLEHTFEAVNGLPQSADEIEIQPAGEDPITADVDNTEVILSAGSYILKLIDDSSVVFGDTTLIKIQEQDLINIGGTTYNGIAETYGNENNTENDYVEGAEFKAIVDAKISVEDYVVDSTNIPILIYKK